jgi:hypothetical protein
MSSSKAVRGLVLIIDANAGDRTASMNSSRQGGKGEGRDCRDDRWPAQLATGKKTRRLPGDPMIWPLSVNACFTFRAAFEALVQPEVLVGISRMRSSRKAFMRRVSATTSSVG